MVNKTFLKLFNNNLFLAKKLKISLNSRTSELSCETYYKMTEHYEKLKNN